MNNENIYEEEEELDFLDLAKTAWSERFTLLTTVGIFFVLGLLIAVISKKEYTAASTFVPQTEAPGGVGKFGGLASLAGINLSSIGASSEIPPSLYPRIVNSVHFKLALLETPITLEEQNLEITYKEYYQNHFNSGFLNELISSVTGFPRAFINILKNDPDKPLRNPKTNSGMISLTETEIELFTQIEDQLSITPDDKEGIVELSYTMPEALMAAEMATAAKDLLQKEVIAYKIQNAREQLAFTQEQFEEKKRYFQKTQKDLANFRDKNQNISSAIYLNQLRSLEAEYNFAFSVYTEIAKQLEQSKLQVSQDTPVFSVINPVTIPFEKSAPRRGLIVITFTFFGIIVAAAIVFSKKYRRELVKQWKEA